jgi:TolB-like protein/class 3 adenylate cyclase
VNTPPSQRRLAAIFAADIVGFSKLMAEDEEGTLSALKLHRQKVFDPEIINRGGRIVKLMGDGTLVEFPSVVDAVVAALAIQNFLANQDGPFQLRIGINLGDVIIDGDDIYGDGVNIAARLEALAKPGGICISSIVHESLGNHINVRFIDTGEHEVKNIPHPIHTYHYQPDFVETASLPEKLDKPSEKPSIAVLPFDNMSGDPEQEYLADGIAEELIVSLGRCRWLLVIARNSTFTYKGTSTDIRRISENLGVRYVLEGSVRTSGSRVRVTTQLIDGHDGSQVWGERYDRQLDDVFALQEEIASVIAGTIKPELETIEGMELRNRPTVDLSAWDCYQRGLWHLYRFTTEELETARVLFERAIDLDSDFSQAYARLAYVLIQLSWYGPRTDRIGCVNEAARIAKQAVELDRRDPAARLSLGRALTLSGEFHQGIEELQVAVELDSNYAQAHFALGQALCSLDRHAEALREIDTSMLLSPRDPHMWTFFQVRTIANYIGGDLEQAEADALAALRQPNVTFYPYTILVPVLGRLGKKQAALDAIQELRRLRPGFSCQEAIDEWHFGGRPVMTHDFMDQFLADMRNAGLPE